MWNKLLNTQKIKSPILHMAKYMWVCVYIYVCVGGVCVYVHMIPWRRDRLPTPVFLGFPGASDGKESTCNAGDLGSIPGLGIPWRRAWQPTPVSCLENPHRQRSLEGYSPWSHKESDTIEWLSTACVCVCIYIYTQVASQVALVDKEPAWQVRRLKSHGFDPWVRRIPWRRK